MSQTVADEFLKAFGANLKTIRTKKKISFRTLAASCNIDHSDISKMEKGQINITIKTLADLAQGLDVPPKKLLDFKFEIPK